MEGLEHAIDTGRATGDDVGVEHHESQSAIAFERIGSGEGADGLFFVVGEPVVATHKGVVFVDLAEALFPVVEFAGGDADPTLEAISRDVGLTAPETDEINGGVARVVRHPLAG